MPSKNLHERPFDEGSLIKLDLFERYAEAWIPTFVMGRYNEFWIFDFFAGTGYDLNGVPGSPIRILRQLNNHVENIFRKNKKVKVCFNEFDKNKYDLLKASCDEYLAANPDLKRAITVYYYNKDLTTLFPCAYQTICDYPSLVYMDQNGIKFMSDTYLLALERTTETDFLYYLSSSYILRFGKTEAFQTNLKIDLERAKQHPYRYIHESVLEQLKEKLPKNSTLKLYPFTIKKQNNFYGVIFGAKHPRAVDKFLTAAWNCNCINGDANFDIDDDAGKKQLDIFEGKKPTKIEMFSKALRELILSENIRTNEEAYNYTLDQGHIAKHASDEVQKMKKEGLIMYSERSPLINYYQVYKNNRIITYTIIAQKHEINKN
jgi:three-Cys-motif partner protein